MITRANLLIAAAATLLVASTAHAVSVESVSPRGEVAQVRQVTVKFSEAVVPLGDLRLPDPFSVQCAGATLPGSGRWVNDRVWVYDFRESVPPGVRCAVKARTEFEGVLEPPRREWFIAGTEATYQRGGSQRVRASNFGIISPVDGSLFALDPDIPRASQRITFEGENGTWTLDGKKLGSGRVLR